MAEREEKKEGMNLPKVPESAKKRVPYSQSEAEWEKKHGGPEERED